MTRHAIQVLRQAGHTQSEVAELTGASIREVRRIEKEPAIEEPPAGEQAARIRGVGRPSKVSEFTDYVEELLESEPKVLTVEVLRRLRLKGYDGREERRV